MASLCGGVRFIADDGWSGRVADQVAGGAAGCALGRRDATLGIRGGVGFGGACGWRMRGAHRGMGDVC